MTDQQFGLTFTESLIGRVQERIRAEERLSDGGPFMPLTNNPNAFGWIPAPPPLQEDEASIDEASRLCLPVFTIQGANPLSRPFNQLGITGLEFLWSIHEIGNQGKGKPRIGVAQVVLLQLPDQRIDLIRAGEQGWG